MYCGTKSSARQGETMANSAKKAQVLSAPKERTRRVLLEGMKELLRRGAPLTVQALAEETGVSRATVYRYFPSNASVALNATMPLTDNPFDDPSWSNRKDEFQRLSKLDVAARAGSLVRVMGEWAFDHERELRTVLALSLDVESATTGLARQGRTNRHRWISTLLADLPPEVNFNERERLAKSLTPLFGADAVVWVSDIAELDREQGLDLLQWMAISLVQATLRGSKERKQASKPLKQNRIS